MIKKVRQLDYIQTLAIKLDDLQSRQQKLEKLSDENQVVFEVNPLSVAKVLQEEIKSLITVLQNLGKEFPVVMVSRDNKLLAVYIAVTGELARELYTLACSENPDLPTQQIEFLEINSGIL